jgi:hypothetical protein
LAPEEPGSSDHLRKIKNPDPAPDPELAPDPEWTPTPDQTITVIGLEFGLNTHKILLNDKKIKPFLTIYGDHGLALRNFTIFSCKILRNFAK